MTHLHMNELPYNAYGAIVHQGIMSYRQLISLKLLTDSNVALCQVSRHLSIDGSNHVSFGKFLVVLKHSSQMGVASHTQYLVEPVCVFVCVRVCPRACSKCLL